MFARLPLLLLTALVWALAGVSAVGWTLRWLEPAPQALPAPAPVVPEVRPQAIAAWLEPAAALPAAAAAAPDRFALLGVIAQGRRGVALLAVDGQAAKPFLVGSLVAEGLVLKAVGPRHADLAATEGDSAPLRLELPPPPQLATPAGMEWVDRAAAH